MGSQADRLSEALKHQSGAATLIKKFFQCENREILELPTEARVQLGSAIARQQGLGQEQVNFGLVDY